MTLTTWVSRDSFYTASFEREWDNRLLRFGGSRSSRTTFLLYRRTSKSVTRKRGRKRSGSPLLDVVSKFHAIALANCAYLDFCRDVVPRSNSSYKLPAMTLG